MKHGKKRKLTSQDMERALKWYDAPPTFGHQWNETEQNYIQTPDTTRPQETLFAPDESVVDLYDYSLSIDSLQPNEESPEDIEVTGLSCEATWVAIEGNPVDHDQQGGHDMTSTKIDYPQPTGLL